jgi:hypothetical protein
MVIISKRLVTQGAQLAAPALAVQSMNRSSGATVCGVFRGTEPNVTQNARIDWSSKLGIPHRATP